MLFSHPGMLVPILMSLGTAKNFARLKWNGESQVDRTRIFQMLLRWLLALGLLAGIVALATLDAVDYSPYFESGYYQSTRARLDSLVASARLSRGTLMVGLGRASLTPRLGAAVNDATAGAFRALPMAGYGVREGAPALGVHDSLFVSAVAVRAGECEVVFVSADALIFPQEVAAAVIKSLQNEPAFRRQQVLFSATHTHSSLGGWGEGYLAERFAGKYDPAVREWFIQQTCAAVRLARADLMAASFGHSAFNAAPFVRNRLVGELGRVDPDFQLAVFRQADGDFAVLGAFSAHATVLSGKNMLISADYPGEWRRAVEAAIPGMAVFFAGEVGSHGPVGPGQEFAAAAAIGQALADSVLRQLPRIPLRSEVSLATIGLQVDLPEVHLRLADGIRLRPWLARHLIPQRRTYLQAVRLDNLLWAGTPCDFSGELGLDLKNEAARAGNNVVITSFDADYVGYIIPGRYYHFNAYEARLMSFFGPNMPDYFQELLRRLFAALQTLEAS